MKTQLSTAGESEPAPGVGLLIDGMQTGDKAGPWVVERELGRGGMGTVYAVVHEEIGKRAALKVVHNRLLVPGFNADRMLIEAKVVNQVGHPNIVDIFETGRLPDGRPYIVMERLAGQPLSYRADDGKILPDLVIAILLQICDALIAAHAAGIVHRDLKLDNVFLVDNADDPTTPRVKLLDWGIAKIINHDVHHTIEGQLVGTPQYLSPEQARGAEVSPQTDVYSLGVMAYELFLEQLPFEAETSAEIMTMHLRATPPPASELWPDIPAALEDLIHQMLAKSPEQRPTTLEVAHRLEAVRGELRERQRKAYASSPTLAPIAVEPVIIVPRNGTPPAFAPTMPADSAEWKAVASSKRWQWAVGAFAIVASACMFLVSRSGDSTAAAAAAPVTVGPSVVQSIQSIEPVGAPREPITPRNTVAEMPVVESTPVAPPAPARVAPRLGARVSVPNASSRKALATPRRAAAKIEPDGTIDPYR